MTDAERTLIHEALRFAVWAAGEGICPVDGEPASAPEDFLMDYSIATGDVDWEGLANSIYTHLAAERAPDARSGGLKPLDEDDYEDIVNAATIRMRKAMSGARGQMVTVQDGLDWWIMKETESRILAALTAAGFRIVGPGEVDPVTLERAAEIAANWGSEIPAEIRALGRKA